jgi:glycosyltransferase involved in cell wall biosynthesis
LARILYFTRDYTTHDHRFLSALSGTEHELYYLQLERRGHQLEDRSLPQKVEGIHWSGGRAPVGISDGLRLLKDLKRVIREVKPDLIQAGPLQRSAFLVALAGFTPLVSMSWGYDLLIDADRSSLWRWATRFTLRRSKLLIGDCDTIRQRAISFGMPDECIVTFPWGIDIQHFSLGPTIPTNDKAFTLLSTRGWEPIYGVDIIAKAFAAAAQKRPELQLIMLGNGSQASSLRKTFLNAGVQDQVLFPGQISQVDLPRYYHSADLYVSASHSDGTSISLLEAMACGRPVLVSDIPGNREWVTPNENGWWFPDGDAVALEKAILDAVDGAQHLQEMGLAARAVVEERANWDLNFQELLKAYKLVL